jgi:hypothetical protein
MLLCFGVLGQFAQKRWLCKVIVGLPRQCCISAIFLVIKRKNIFCFDVVPCLQLCHAIFDLLLLPLPLFLHFGWRSLISCKMKKKCDRGHSPVRHFCWWSKFSYRVWYVPYIYILLLMKLYLLTQSHSLTVHRETATTGSASFEGHRAMTLLKEKVLKGIVLRRTEICWDVDLALPPKVVSVICLINLINPLSTSCKKIFTP